MFLSSAEYKVFNRGTTKIRILWKKTSILSGFLSQNSHNWQKKIAKQFAKLHFLDDTDHGHSERAFLKKSQTFGLEQTNRAEIFWGIWCIIGQTISESLAHVFHYLTIISTKIFTSKSKIFVCDCDLVFGCPSSVDTIDQNINFAKLPSAKWLVF